MNTTVTTFKITVSVPGHISDECVTSVVKGLDRISKSMFAAIELGKDDAHRHLHVAVLFKKNFPTYNAQTTWKSRFFKEKILPYHPDAKPKRALTMPTMFDHEWFDSYLRGTRPGEEKPPGEIFFDNYDRDAFEAAFPDPETQAALIKKRDGHTLPDPLYVRLSSWFREDYPEQTHVSRRDWALFINECFLKRRFDYKDERTRNELMKKSYRYMVNDGTLDESQEKWAKVDEYSYKIFDEEEPEEEELDEEEPEE